MQLGCGEAVHGPRHAKARAREETIALRTILLEVRDRTDVGTSWL